MSNENRKIQNSDCNSGESDFEIVNHSDSEIEINGYSRLASLIETNQNLTNSAINNQNQMKNSLRLQPTTNEKIQLSLSQGQISILGSERNTKSSKSNVQLNLDSNKIVQKQDRNDRYTQDDWHHQMSIGNQQKGAIKKSTSITITTRLNNLSIKPIGDEGRIDRTTTSSAENLPKIQKVNLPEIVLTSFENQKAIKNKMSEVRCEVNGANSNVDTDTTSNRTNASGIITSEVIDASSNNTNRTSSGTFDISNMTVPVSTPGHGSSISSGSDLSSSSNSLSSFTTIRPVVKSSMEAQVVMASEIQVHRRQSNTITAENYLTARKDSISSSASHFATILPINNRSRNRNNSMAYIDGDVMRALDFDNSIMHPIMDNDLKAGSCELDNLILDDIKESFPKELKCQICFRAYNDPRTLNCLHSFCFQCLVDENYGKDSSIPFWSIPECANIDWNRTTASITQSNSGTSTTDSDNRPESRLSINSSRSKKNSERLTKEKRSLSNANSRNMSIASVPVEKMKILICSICNYATEMPIGGIRQLPQNFILNRKLDNFLMQAGKNVIDNIFCSLCCVEIIASYHCLTCTVNLCNLCKESHERQRTTLNHNIRSILELKKSKISTKNYFSTAIDNGRHFKCSLHPGFDLKSFCLTCHQLICPDCFVLLHKGHKTESVQKAYKTFHKLVRESSDKTKPMYEYAAHSKTKLTEISKKINQKCDAVQQQVELYMAAYFQAVEVHRRTLLQQVARARETKIQLLLEHQMDYEKQSNEAKQAVEFTEEVLTEGSDVEFLTFVNILVKRFDFCQKFIAPIDAKISETLNFFPDIRAPSTKAQNNIPLFGIITTQTVEPKFCTLEPEVCSELRVHRKAEILIISRDTDDVPLCHGGLNLIAQIKYKDASSRIVPIEVSDKRDGTYAISFIPDAPGILTLMITINGKHIKGSPFMICARTIRPHTGIFHCCTFCSSKGSKTTTCACNGVMNGFKGCGHGHYGHPGRRHWSCCGSILENSECTTANNFFET